MQIMNNIREKIENLSNQQYLEFRENLSKKINSLPDTEKNFFNKELDNIISSKYDCMIYGAEDPISLPRKDEDTIKINLYEQMFKEKIFKEIFQF